MPETQFRINSYESGIRFSAVIQPSSSQNEISGILCDSLKIRLTSPPVDGAANRTCIKFLAKSLGISPSKIRVVKGHNKKNKTIEIEDIDESVFLNKLTTKIPNLLKKDNS
jgi:uncharacterized protein